MHHLKNKLSDRLLHNKMQMNASPGNVQPRLDLRKAGYGFAEITLERDMNTIRATVGDVFISYTKEKKPDPYVMLVVGGSLQETSFRRNTKHAFFGESFVFQCHPNSVMDVYVVDKDWRRDDLMFNGSIPLDQLPMGRKVTVHVRREPGASCNDYNLHNDIPPLAPDSPIFVPPNQYANETPIFYETYGDVRLYVYDIVDVHPPVPPPVDFIEPVEFVEPVQFVEPVPVPVPVPAPYVETYVETQVVLDPPTFVPY